MNENAGEHRRARWHVDVERVPGEANGFSGRFDSEDEEAIEKELDFVGHLMIGGKLKPIVAATEESSPIATVDFTFERDGSGWKHRGFVHTVADRQALDADRAELDGRLRDLLQGSASDGWTTVSFNYAWDESLRVIRMVGTQPEKLPTEGAAADLLAAYLSFFAKRGIELQDMRGVLNAKPKGKFELTLSYGVPHAKKGE